MHSTQFLFKMLRENIYSFEDIKIVSTFTPDLCSKFRPERASILGTSMNKKKTNKKTGEILFYIV